MQMGSQLSVEYGFVNMSIIARVGEKLCYNIEGFNKNRKERKEVNLEKEKLEELRKHKKTSKIKL